MAASFLFSRPFLWRDSGGTREASWRAWLLIWLAPALFALAAAALAVEATVRTVLATPVEARVVQVYSWPSTDPWTHGTMQYAPVFAWTDDAGRERRASVNLRRAGWNLPVGSTHTVLVPPGGGDVALPGPHNWIVAGVIAAIAAVLALPALWLHLRLRRWLKGAR